MRELLSVAHLDGLRELVADLGGDLEALATEIGLGDSLNDDADRYFSNRKLIELVNLAARKSRRRDFGLIWGVRSSMMLLGPLGVAMLNAPTARRAAKLFVENLPKQNQVLRPAFAHLDRSGLELLSLVHEMKRPPSLVHVLERNLVLLTSFFRGLIGGGFTPAGIWLSHAQQADDDAYRRAFGMLPRFEQPVYGLVLKSVDLDRRVAGHRREIFDMAVSHLGRTPAPGATADDPVLGAAAAVLATNRSYTLSEVARIMGVHVRGLQRRLHDAGVTYSMLRDNARRREAERLLRDGNRALTEIALELGFKDQAAFTRASRRWFGLTPTAARIQLRERFEQDTKHTPRTHALAVAHRLRSRPEGV